MDTDLVGDVLSTATQEKLCPVQTMFGALEVRKDCMPIGTGKTGNKQLVKVIIQNVWNIVVQAIKIISDKYQDLLGFYFNN